MIPGLCLGPCCAQNPIAHTVGAERSGLLKERALPLGVGTPGFHAQHFPFFMKFMAHRIRKPNAGISVQGTSFLAFSSRFPRGTDWSHPPCSPLRVRCLCPPGSGHRCCVRRQGLHPEDGRPAPLSTVLSRPSSRLSPGHVEGYVHDQPLLS